MELGRSVLTRCHEIGADCLAIAGWRRSEDRYICNVGVTDQSIPRPTRRKSVGMAANMQSMSWKRDRIRSSGTIMSVLDPPRILPCTNGSIVSLPATLGRHHELYAANDSRGFDGPRPSVSDLPSGAGRCPSRTACLFTGGARCQTVDRSCVWREGGPAGWGGVGRACSTTHVAGMLWAHPPVADGRFLLGWHMTIH